MTKPDRDKMLEVLLHELTEIRNDDRSMHRQFPTVITAAVALIAAMAALYATTCAYGPCKDAKMYVVPIWAYIAAPALPILLVSYATLISTLGTLRSYYRRTIERKIHELTSQSNEQFPVPSWAHIELEVMGQTRSHPRSRLNWIFIYGTLVFLVLGGCVALASKITEPRYRIFALVLNGALVLIPISAGAMSISHGARLWHDATAGLRRRLLRTDSNFEDSARIHERSLLSYLLLPRNQEELLKALFIPAGLIIGLVLAPGIPKWTWNVQDWSAARSGFWHFLGFFIVFELLIYQGRYLFNDVRDRFLDCGNNLSKDRFPCSWVHREKYGKNYLALKLAFGSCLVRVGLAALIVGCILPYADEMWVWHAGFLVGVVLIAALYELARGINRTAWGTWTLTLVVGLGYGLRAAVGLWLAGVDCKWALALLACGALAFGSMFVALTWALESTRAERGVLAKDKPHLVLYHDIVTRTAHRRGVPAVTSERVLVGRQEWYAPWCVSGAISTGLLAAFVLNLHQVHIDIGLLLLIAAGFATASEGVAVDPVKMAWVLTALGFVLAVIIFHIFSIPWRQCFIAALVTALPLIVTCSFREMSFDKLPNVMNKVGGFFVALSVSLFNWFKKERNT